MHYVLGVDNYVTEIIFTKVEFTTTDRQTGVQTDGQTGRRSALCNAPCYCYMKVAFCCAVSPGGIILILYDIASRVFK